MDVCSRLTALLGLLAFTLFISLSSQLHAQSKNMSLLGQLSYAQDLNDIWGYVDGAGEEYALVGTYNGVSIVSLANPAVPVEHTFVPGVNSTWRDIKVWGNYAYITNESSGGLMIINLSNLPGSINLLSDVSSWGGGSWSGGTVNFSRAHNIYIDENGIAYITGANYQLGGAIMADLTVNPVNPPVVGVYNGAYAHDCWTRGDTLWTAEINVGRFAVVDVSTKASPVIIGQASTFNNFTHNIWANDNNQAAFSTDEQAGAYIQAHDVSDLSNISELDKIRSSLSNGAAIPHNVHVQNDYIVTSYYRDGVNVVDASRPHNLVETGYYDTSPLSGGGFNGAWGAYPFLPSGKIIVSDIENGLFVFQPSYTRGCYLEGVVTDNSTGLPLFNVDVTINGTSLSDFTDPQGNYAVGIADSGSYMVSFNKSGYLPNIQTVNLQNGVLTTLNVALIPIGATNYNVKVSEKGTGNPIQGAFVFVDLNNGGYSDTTDMNGEALGLELPQGDYILYAGKWGYETDTILINVFDTVHNWKIALEKGYYDDFYFGFDWTVTGDATTGLWERGEPIGTVWNGIQMNPEVDATGDFGDKAFVTGNAGGGAGSDDVDNGTTTLRSPVMDLSNMMDPILKFDRWFANAGGSTPLDDTLFIRINNGITTVDIDTIFDESQNLWKSDIYYVKDHISLTASMQVRFSVSDIPAPAGNGHLVEAAVDRFSVKDYPFTCGKDIHEPNDIQSSATNLFGGALLGAGDKRICPRGDEDWFYYLHTQNGKSFSVELKHLPSDYLLEIYNSSGLLAGSYVPSTEDKILFVNLAASGDYYIRVYGHNSAWHPTESYSLLINNAIKPPKGIAGIKLNANNPQFRIAQDGFKVYPNPSQGIFIIQLPDHVEGSVDLKVLDLNGSTVAEMQHEVEKDGMSAELNLPELAAGTYFIEVRSTNQSWVEKAVILK